VGQFSDFLRELHSRTPDGYGVEVRRIPGAGRVLTLADISDPDDLDTANYYHGVTPRKLRDGVSDVGFLVWCDCDGSQDDPLDIDPKPSCILHSGRVNGYHLYWRLEEGVSTERVEAMSTFATVALQGDFAVCQHRLTFRAPYSVNTKYTPPRKVEVVEWDKALEYSPDLLEESLVAACFARHYVDGERHGLTMALAAILARATWPIERTLRTIESLYDMNPGSDLKGKLADVRSTYDRIARGEPCSTAKLRALLDKDAWVKFQDALGLTARDGDIVIADTVIGKVANMERDLVNYLLGTGTYAGAAGKIATWADTHWALGDEGMFASEVFKVLGEAQYIKQGDAVDFPATAKVAKAVASMVNGRLQSAPMPPAEPYYLPLQNGTLDLRTLTLEETTKEHRHLWVVPVAWDPTARCPDWEKFLEEAVPNPSVADHLQEWMGYLLMAGNRWQRMLWLHGRSGTGKSTFIKAASMLLGPAAVAISTDKMTDYTIAQLAGARIGVCSELAPSLLRTSVVKSLVAGDALQARHPYGRPFTVVFDGKLVWGSNALPTLDQGEGMWRRIVPVEFQVVPSHKDDDLDAKVVAEGAGILNWAIAGLKRVMAERERRGPWALPTSVQKTVDAYRSSSDPTVTFAAEEMTLGEDKWCPVLTVYQRFSEWCKERGLYVRPMDTVFFQDFAKLGLEVDPTHVNGLGDRVTYFRGGLCTEVEFGRRYG
jgi:P4 family phage/plasmid primase-like protien